MTDPGPASLGPAPGPGPDASDASAPDLPVVPDAARAVLSRVRASARAAAAAGPTAAASPAGRRTGRARPRRTAAGFSGPGPDDRDPTPLGGAWDALVADQGWRRALDAGSIHGLWPQIVGPANAEHATPESYDPDSGELVVRTSSTAWAEQLRLMMPVLRSAIDAHIGSGVVREIRVIGPTPPRTRGRLRVRGRGPRDTYG
jgi:predicted nucleic acid-binding Zn ribbon protein